MKLSSIVLCSLLLSAFSFAETIKDSQGNEYTTVKIGDQVWMAQNLNVKTDRSYCYDNDPANCEKYGRLYTWAAAMKLPEYCNDNDPRKDSRCKTPDPWQGICPDGFKVPNQRDFIYLDDFFAEGGAGKYLKSSKGWKNNGNGNDRFGFALLPAGSRIKNGEYSDKGNEAILWTSDIVIARQWSGQDRIRAYAFFFDANSQGLNFEDIGRPNGFSLRCIKVMRAEDY